MQSTTELDTDEGTASEAQPEADQAAILPFEPPTPFDPLQAYQEQNGEKNMSDLLLKACVKGPLNSVELILDYCQGEDLTGSTSSDGTLSGPRHYASRGGHAETVDFLLRKGFPPFKQDFQGNTELHLAACNGHLQVVQKLLNHASVCNAEASESQRTDHQCLNKDGLSPLGSALKGSNTPHYHVARECLKFSTGNPVDTFPDFGKYFLTKYTGSSLDKPVKIFVIGDRGVGKSTFTRALQEERSVLSKYTFGLAASSRRIRGLQDQHFSGVTNSDFYNPSSKRVVFYDLAAHTNYFSKDLVDSPDDVMHSIFIILINMRDECTKMITRLVFWLNFLYHHLSSSTCLDDMKPNVVVIGSHPWRTFWGSADNERLMQTFTLMQQENSKLTSVFNFIVNPTSLDCRKFQTSDMRQLRATVYKTCLRIAPNSPPPLSMCYILSSLFHSEDFSTLPALTIRNLSQLISANYSKQELSLYHLLPSETDQLYDICKELSAHERIFLLPNSNCDECVDDMWIVHNSGVLLTEIDSKLSSMKNADLDESMGPNV